RLVHLEQVDLADGPARLVQHARDRTRWREQEQVRLTRELRLGRDPRERRRAEIARAGLAGDDEGGRTVVELGRVPRRHRAVRLDGGLRAGQSLEGGLSRTLARSDPLPLPLPPLRLARGDLGIERARSRGRRRLLVRAEREAVLILAGESGL